MAKGDIKTTKVRCFNSSYGKLSKKRKKETIFREKKKSVSFLLGAGFSAHMGYPVGKQLNERILFCIDCDNCLSFSSDGALVTNNDGRKPDLGYKDLYYFDFCKDAIRYYNDNIKKFDYENFYDYLKEDAINDGDLRQLFENGDYEKNEFENFERYLSQMDIIYNQLVAFFIKDKDGNSWYENASFYCKPVFDGYTGFLNCMEQLLGKRYKINIHTLNHGLFFERLNNTEWINGNLRDGFEEKDSPYFGRKSDGTKKTLSRYTGKNYHSKINLFKLHGSVDYYVYYTDRNKTAVMSPNRYIKSKQEIGITDFYKKNVDGSIENSPNNYHPDFLTGTLSKIERYKEPLLYKKLFRKFRENLNNAEKLIIIGYGSKDCKINDYIIDCFGKKKPCYIVKRDHNSEPEIEKFSKRIGNNARLVIKKINDLQLSDFDL